MDWGHVTWQPTTRNLRWVWGRGGGGGGVGRGCRSQCCVRDWEKETQTETGSDSDSLTDGHTGTALNVGVEGLVS